MCAASPCWRPRLRQAASASLAPFGRAPTRAVTQLSAALTLILPAAQKQYGWFLEAAPEDIAYLADLPFSLALPSHGVLVVHAGLVPGVPLPRQSLHDLIEARTRARSNTTPRTGPVWWCKSEERLLVPSCLLGSRLAASMAAATGHRSGQLCAQGRLGVHGGGHGMPRAQRRRAVERRPSPHAGAGGRPGGEQLARAAQVPAGRGRAGGGGVAGAAPRHLRAPRAAASAGPPPCPRPPRPAAPQAQRHV